MSATEFPDGSWTVLRVPRSHWHCQLSNFDWHRVRPASLPERVAGFIQAVADGGGPHMILTGDPGIGKSHLGVAVYRQGVHVWGTELCTWINVPAFCDHVKASYDDRQYDPFEAYRAARRLVVLDDLFGRELSNHEISQIVYRLIDIAYMNGAAVMLNMNPEITRIATYLGPHEVSRVLADATVIPVEADRDWRRRR